MRFHQSLFVSHSREKFACEVEISIEAAKLLLEYERAAKSFPLPYLFITVEHSSPLIVNTDRAHAFGTEEFQICPEGVVVGLIDVNGTTLSTGLIKWHFLHSLVESTSLPNPR